MLISIFNDGGPAGPLATIDCEPRQARKGAAVTVDSSAGVWLSGLPPNLVNLLMSYIALARKWRPRTFSQLVGQDHINKALINSLNQQRLHHAYLFTGTRGVGKTSVARLLAKALNCEQGISAEPCLQCDACVAIEQGRFIDLIEIDGASKTRVEDTREILENVQYAPTTGRFKIYLIDEVHMLSQHSFNALLKTLEEPPSHVKFILATTDPQKLPVTVLSRCLQFNLKHLQPAVISQYLQQILDDEKFSYDLPALTLIANAARGSMRDALSLLDQVIASCDNHLHAHDVKNCLGYTQQDYALQLLHALAELAPEKLLAISKKIAEEGAHFRYVLDEMLSYLHQISINLSIEGTHQLISPAPEITELSTQFTPEDTQLFYQIGLKGLHDMTLAPTVAIGFEMTLLRMYTFKPATKIKLPPLAYKAVDATKSCPSENIIVDNEQQPVVATKIEVQAQENIMITPVVAETNCPVDNRVEISDDILEQSNTSALPLVTQNTVEQVPQRENLNWVEILSRLKLQGLALSAAEHAELISKSEGSVVLRVAKGHQSVFTSAVLNRIELALTNYYGENIKLSLNSEQHVLSSPMQQRQVIQKKQHEDAEAALQNDPFFQQLQQEFSAELVKNSISTKDVL